MKRYPDYRDSGLPWLGDVPAHWDIQKLKHIFRVFNGSTPSSNVLEYWNGDITWVTPDDLGSLKTDTIIQTRRNITISGYKNCGTVLIPPNSIVLSTRAPIGHLAIAGVELCTNQGCRSLVFRSKVHDVRFFFFQLLAIRDELKARGQGSTFQELGKNELETITLVLPPLPEQRAIVAYLDHKLALIDRYLANKRRMIELLHEQKQAIINHAVTRGLDPTAPLKPSGVAWLGDVPAGWDVRRNKYIFYEVNERSKTGQETRLSMSQRLGLVESDRVEDKSLQAETADGFKICRKGDLVLNKLKSHLGVFAHAKMTGLVSPDYTVLRPIKETNVRYFELLYKHPAYIAAFTKAATGIVVGFLRLYTSEFYNIQSPYPPIEEQEKIMHFIDTEVAKINHAIAQTEREIALMHEYRTTLISEVVTGKVDVSHG